MPSISAPPPTSAKIFTGKTFVLQGNFGKYPRMHQNISRLIAQHGGHVDPKVTMRTTHVVTTLEEFRKMPPNSKFLLASSAIPFLSIFVISSSLLALCFLEDLPDVLAWQSRRPSPWAKPAVASCNGSTLKTPSSPNPESPA